MPKIVKENTTTTQGIDMNQLLEHFPDIGIGTTPTFIPEVTLFKAIEHKTKQPVIYESSICIVLQGHKIGYLGEHAYRYDANNYLITMTTMPFKCETFATPETPLVGLMINVDTNLLRELIAKTGPLPDESLTNNKTQPKGMGAATMDAEMKDAVHRLIKILASKQDCDILSPGLIREILYRTLQGSQAPLLYSLAAYRSAFSKVNHILSLMRHNYSERLDIEKLASQANMSTSAFHRTFKEITSDSPMQYLKKIRLNKARDFIEQEHMKAYIAANMVGYKSASQFSREFKRYFGQTPADLSK